MEKQLKSKTPEYYAWQNLRKRCYNKTDKRYPLYGGRGIKVCDRWLGKDGFDNFLSDMGPRPKNTTGREWSIDRINTDGDYSPENCRWATATTQCRNKSNNLSVHLWGERYCVTEACEILKINRHNFYRYNATHRHNDVDTNLFDYLTLLKRKEKLYA